MNKIMVKNIKSYYHSIKNPEEHDCHITLRLSDPSVKAMSYYVHSKLNLYDKILRLNPVILFPLALRMKDDIKNTSYYLRDSILNNINTIGLSTIKYLYGDLKTNHGLYCECDIYLPQLNEPQITHSLAKALNNTEKETRKERIMSFLKAIGVCQNTLNDITCCDLNKITVNAEHPIRDKRQGKSRRIDLTFLWPSQNNQKKYSGVIIEVKFGHEVTTRQLPAYKEWAQELELYELVLITPQGEKDQLNNDWLPISWWSLMSRWEKYLSDSSQDLAIVKKLIWNKIGG